MESKTVSSKIIKSVISVVVSICMVMASFSVASLQSIEKAFAVSGETPILEVTAKTSVFERTFKITMEPSAWNPSQYVFATDLNSKTKILGISEKENTAHISVKNLRPDLVDSNSIQYERALTPSYSYYSGSVSFRLIGSSETSTCSYTLQCSVGPLTSLQAVTNASSKGFNPSKNNSISLYALLDVSDGFYNFGTTKTRASLSFRVLNSAGKTVFTKSYKNTFIFQTFSIAWDGKASKGNGAKIKAGKYVPAGKYTLEVVASSTRDGQVIENLASSTQFKVSKKAPKGFKGKAKAKALVLLTGDAEVDYMAEKMLKAAGVKSSMSADKKVKRIYSYMVKHFKHNHGDKKYTVYYNLKKLKSKIAAYKKTADAKVARGKAYYSHLYEGISWNMARRAGVCDHNAAFFVILCNHAGVHAVSTGGYYKNTNGSLSPHAWNAAVVNGKTYYYDIDVEIQNRGKGQGNFYWYKKTLAQSKKNHKYLK